MKHKHNSKYRLMSLLLVVVMALSLVPTAFASQDPAYHDPAEHWQTASNRTNELDVNSVVTHETFYCPVCEKYTSFMLWRVPEYTRDGQTALTRNVQFSDGTLVGGEGKGNILDGTPGKDAYYTGYHWTKSMCEICGTMNSNMSTSDYGYGKNIYWLYDCAIEFMEKLPDTVSYEYTDSTYHTITTKGGEFCVFCFGTRHNDSSKLERHSMDADVLPQPANGRFATLEHCTVCDYQKYSYTAAKAVIADYYGVVDGKPHTISVTDLSEADVITRIRYGNSADSCTLTNAPSYTEKGQYTVYYEITYTYKGVNMTENGVAYVWLRDESVADDGSCACGCGDPDCGCMDKDCNGKCKNNTGCGDNHKFVLLDSVDPTCLTLGYDRYLCTACGKIEKHNYEAALGHAYQGVVIREATCENGGKLLEICSRCGNMKETSTPKGEHKYSTYNVAATCTSSGYTVKECSVCGDRHITDITNALAHNYKSKTIAPTCNTGGKTIHECEWCGSSFVTDYTAALDHSWDNGKVIATETCCGNGVKEYRCVRCGELRLEAISASGHTPGDSATCTNPQICTKCGAILENAKGHDFKSKTVDATCTEMGYTEYTCSRCNISYKTDYTQPLGHNHVANVTDPTCLESGYTTYVCSRCNDTYVSDYTDPLGHEWNKGNMLTAPTCTSEGVIEYRCVRCDHSRMETVAAKGHTPGEPATCTEPQLCTECGAVLARAKSHDFKATVIDPTCTEMGYTEYACSRCGISYKTEYTQPLGHNHVANVTEPTCLEPGYTTYICSRCNDTYMSDHTDPLGHKWGEGNKITVSTCQGEGVMEFRCVRCDYHHLEAISAEGHTPGDPATCTDPQLCTECGAVLAKALGHDYTAEVTVPTCTEMGYTTYTCSRCGDSYKGDYTDATGHNPGDWIIDKEPTVDSEGSRHKECENCGKVTDSESIDRLKDRDITDSHGEATVGGYLIIVTDTDTKKPVMGALVALELDDTLSICLPDGRLLDYADQTTVTVLVKADKSAVPGISISVTDKNDNYCSDMTDEAGQITVPGTSGKTNKDGKITAGWEDADGNRHTLTIRVEDFETKRPIVDAGISIGRTGRINVALPDGEDMDEDNRITVIVTDHERTPQMGLSVTVKSDLGRTEQGETDKNGRLTVPPVTEVERHVAYIVGYEDGTFGPERNMTRSEAAAIFARILAAKNGDTITATAKTKFEDVPANAWYSGYVRYLSNYGIIYGRRENTFAPNEAITRAEFVAMSVRFFEVYGDGDPAIMEQYSGFDDVSSGYWAAEYIKDAAIRGWIKGYGDGTFRADHNITRAEVVTIVNRLLGRNADEAYITANLSRLNTFSDMELKHWAFFDVMEASNTHTATINERMTGK